MKTKTRGLLVAGLMAALLVGPMAASALTVTFPSTPQPFVLNFDLSGASPAPNYSQLWFEWHPSVPPPSGSYYCALFGEANGTGSASGGCAFSLMFGSDFGAGLTADALDGRFSVALSAPAGYDVVDPCVVGIDATGTRTSCVAGSVPGAVPEPGTLALLGLGLVGLCATRRRQAW